MISEKNFMGVWVGSDYQVCNRFSGPYFETFWWVSNNMHRLYGFQAISLLNARYIGYWCVNNKGLDAFKKARSWRYNDQR